MRFVLTTANGTLKGTRAVAMVYGLAKNVLFDKQLPATWKKMTKVQRMKFLEKYLPADIKLTCIREIKHTRKDKSLYVKTYKENKLPPIDNIPPQAAQNAVNFEVQWPLAAGRVRQNVNGNVVPVANAPAPRPNDWANILGREAAILERRVRRQLIIDDIVEEDF